MIHTLDSGYLGREQFDAVYAVQSQSEWALIDAATQPAVPKLLKQLDALGAVPEQVRYLIVTHVHLDHSGGAAALMEYFPHATLLAHSRALRHLSDPTRLVESARAVYGTEKFNALYGDIRPIPASRIRTVGEGERVDLGSGQFQFFDTPGHAKHHISAIWEEDSALFSGDALGLRYPSLHGLTLATTSPIDFDPQAMLTQIERFRGLMPRVIYPTHYGAVSEVGAHLEQLERSVRTSESLARQELSRWDSHETAEIRTARLKEALQRAVQKEVQHQGLTWGAQEWEWLDLDLELNAQGLAHWVTKESLQ